MAKKKEGPKAPDLYETLTAKARRTEEFKKATEDLGNKLEEMKKELDSRGDITSVAKDFISKAKGFEQKYDQRGVAFGGVNNLLEAAIKKKDYRMAHTILNQIIPKIGLRNVTIFEGETSKTMPISTYSGQVLNRIKSAALDQIGGTVYKYVKDGDYAKAWESLQKMVKDIKDLSITGKDVTDRLKIAEGAIREGIINSIKEGKADKIDLSPLESKGVKNPVLTSPEDALPMWSKIKEKEKEYEYAAKICSIYSSAQKLVGNLYGVKFKETTIISPHKDIILSAEVPDSQVKKWTNNFVSEAAASAMAPQPEVKFEKETKLKLDANSNDPVQKIAGYMAKFGEKSVKIYGPGGVHEIKLEKVPYVGGKAEPTTIIKYTAKVKAHA